MSDYEYTGPRVPRTRKNEVIVRRRFRKQVNLITDVEFDEAVKAWAEANEGPFPDRERIRRRVTTELETVCRGLDGWGAVDPDTILGRDWRFDLFD